MEIEVHIIDAFTDSVFGGNSAAVIMTESWLSDELMQSIAIENNLSETAFLVKQKDHKYGIRWFSPIKEIAFCGHATLASSFVIFSQCQEVNELIFVAKAVGELSVVMTEHGMIQMNFPNTKPKKVTHIPQHLISGLSIEPAEVYRNSQAYFVIYESESDVLSVTRNNEILKLLEPLDVCVTSLSKSDDYDFVSRYFWPSNGGDEDPVTGSIHTGLAPFWADRLGKSTLVGYQASSRGGIVECEVIEDRVVVSGNAVQYLKGTVVI